MITKTKSLTLLLVSFVMAAMLALTACASQTHHNNDDSSFVVGFDQNFPPFGFVGNDGAYTGFDLEVAQEVAKRQGWTFVAQPINWDAKDAEINAGTIDCIWNGFTIQGREDAYAFTSPYMDNAQVIVVRADSGIQSFADLAGKNVQTQVDSAALHLFEGENKELANSFKQLVLVPDYNTGFQDLAAGATDALAMDLTVANYQIKDRPEDFYILPEQLAKEQYGVAFKKDNTELRDKVQQTLEEMAKDGSLAEISSKYFGSDVTRIAK